MSSQGSYQARPSSTRLNPNSRPLHLDMSSDPRESEEDYTKFYYYNDLDADHRSQHSNTCLSPAAPGVGKGSASTLTLAHPDDERHLNNMNGTLRQSPPLPLSRRSPFLQALFPDSLACRLYLIVVLVETALDLAIESIILARVNDVLEQTHSPEAPNTHLARSRIPVYLGVFGMAHIFQFLLALDAVYYKNVLQFIFLAVFNALFFLYAVIQIFEVEVILQDSPTGFKSSEILTILIPIVVCIAEVAYIGLAWKIYNEFGWQIFKLLGADRSIKRIYMQYQIFQCFMRFDAFFWIGFSIQLIALILQKGDFEFYLTIAALPLSMLLIYEGHLAARHESKWMMGVFGFGCSAAMVYFCYKLIRIWTQRNTDTYHTVYKSLTVFAAVSVVMLILTCVWAVLVYQRFDRGLKGHLNKSKITRQEQFELGKSGSRGRFPHGDPRILNRMSIE